MADATSATMPAGVAFTPPVETATAKPAAVAPPATQQPAQAAPPAPTLLDAVLPKAEPIKAEPAKEAPKAEPPKPADYSKLEVPKDSLLPATHKEKIAAFASKHSLSPEVAQEVLKQQSTDIKEYVDGQVKAYEDTKKSWADALKAHPKFSGDQLAEYNRGATEVINKYGSPALMKMLQESGYAYKVEVAELLSNVWNAMRPDKMVLPGTKTATSAQDQSPEAVAKRMFPNSKHV